MSISKRQLPSPACRTRQDRERGRGLRDSPHPNHLPDGEGTARRRAGLDQHRQRLRRDVPGDAAGHGDERRPPRGRQAPHAERGRCGGLFRRSGAGAGHEHAGLHQPSALRRVRRHGLLARGPRPEFGLLRAPDPGRLEQGGPGLLFLRFSQVHGPGLGHPAKGPAGAADGRHATRPGPSR